MLTKFGQKNRKKRHFFHFFHKTAPCSTKSASILTAAAGRGRRPHLFHCAAGRSSRPAVSAHPSAAPHAPLWADLPKGESGVRSLPLSRKRPARRAARHIMRIFRRRPQRDRQGPGDPRDGDFSRRPASAPRSDRRQPPNPRAAPAPAAQRAAPGSLPGAALHFSVQGDRHAARSAAAAASPSDSFSHRSYSRSL